MPGLERPGETAPEFTAVVYGHGLNVAVNLPEEVSGWFGDRGKMRVLGLLNGIGMRATLMPRGAGRHRLYLNAAMRQEAGVAVGDSVGVVLWRAPEARD
jgi:hypothetical protein